MTVRKPVLADALKCTGCMACVASCHTSALSRKMGEDGHVYVSLDAEKCVGCLSCEKVCKKALSATGNNSLEASSPYAAWANDGQVRQGASSGGFATAAGLWCLRNGGKVVTSAFDGRHAAHTLVSSEEGLRGCQGSKYVWSDASKAYESIAENLPSGKVLFIGTGCQVAGVLAFFDGHPYRQNLYTIDLICGGVPSGLLMQAFFDSNPSVEALTAFRNKRKYELRGIKDGGEVVLPQDSLPLSGFCTEQTMRGSCYDCPFAFAHRQSDLSIGDFWGDSSPADQREEGVSLVIVHSEKGREILSEADVSSVPADWRNVLPGNRRLVFGRTPRTALRKSLAHNYRKMSSVQFSRVYGATSSVSDPLGFAWRLWLHVLRKVYSRKSDKTVKQILAQ